MNTRFWFGLSLALTLVGAYACSDDDAIDEIEADEECDEACEGWEDCVGEQFDVIECRQRCFEAIDDDRTDTDTADDCDDCLEDAGDQCAVTCLDVCRDAFVVE